MTTTGLQIEINNLPFEQRKEVEKFVESLKIKIKPESTRKNREFGYFKGQIKLSDDFDAPLEDFSEYM